MNLQFKKFSSSFFLYLRLFGLHDRKENLTLTDFLVGVGQLRFRGTSVLFRLTKSIVDFVTFMNSSDDEASSLTNLYAVLNKIDRKSARLERYLGGPGKPPEERSEAYEIATHTVKVKRTGMVAGFTAVWDLEGAATPTIKLELFSDNQKPNFGRNESVDFFNQVRLGFVCLFF